ncbi:hypothetical protein [Pseudoalteromonas obscura]|uniref:Lipoprotein n=1 Tax=Pseudoalteromonas obscura TaxID=3048491 RepID=A0ABT7EMA9_9GAMM|nr:hypothetical protein [Pseudoalteromonas sp. P94(2023)]MDK2596191.1 hypothetical protein [Pseudoalteromonas sp. P94(2023)]
MLYLRAIGLFILVVTLLGCGSDSSVTPLPEPPEKQKTQQVTKGIDLYLFNREVDQKIDTHIIKRASPYQANTPVAHQNLIFGLDTVTETVVIASSFSSSMWPAIISKAYARSPEIKTTKESIKSIKITSAYDFNEDFLAGSILNQLFSVTFATFPNKYFSYKEENRIYTTLNTYIETANNAPLTPLGLRTDLILNTPPNAQFPMTFYIEIELDDGQMFTIESPEIQFISNESH